MNANVVCDCAVWLMATAAATLFLLLVGWLVGHALKGHTPRIPHAGDREWRDPEQSRIEAETQDRMRRQIGRNLK
jgi:hypothetical protein